MKQLPRTTVSIYPLGTKVWIVCPKMTPRRKFVPVVPSGTMMIRRGVITQAMTHTMLWYDTMNKKSESVTDVQYKVEYKNPSTKMPAYTDCPECDIFATGAEAAADAMACRF